MIYFLKVVGLRKILAVKICFAGNGPILPCVPQVRSARRGLHGAGVRVERLGRRPHRRVGAPAAAAPAPGGAVGAGRAPARGVRAVGGTPAAQRPRLTLRAVQETGRRAARADLQRERQLLSGLGAGAVHGVRVPGEKRAWRKAT